MGAGRWRRLLDGAVVVAGALVVSAVLDRLGVPSPALFGGVVAGLVRALARPVPMEVPRSINGPALVVVGVTIGVLVDPGTLRAVGVRWLPVLLVVLGTLVISLVAGWLMRLQRGIGPVTGALAMIAGGAEGVTAMARELAADHRMVAVLQYLRVLLIVAFMPVVASSAYGASASGSGGLAQSGGPGWAVGLLFTAACGVVGLVLGRLVRIPVPTLLGPMIVAAAADLGGLSQGAVVPGGATSLAFLVIGLQVGLNFTRESLRTIGRALPLALVIILGLIAACAGMGLLLAQVTDASALDAYLATTPGGLTAVLAVASDSGADATFVLAVQVVRLFAMVFSAPLIGRWLRRARPAD